MNLTPARLQAYAQEEELKDALHEARSMLDEETARADESSAAAHEAVEAISSLRRELSRQHGLFEDVEVEREAAVAREAETVDRNVTLTTELRGAMLELESRGNDLENSKMRVVNLEEAARLREREIASLQGDEIRR